VIIAEQVSKNEPLMPEAGLSVGRWGQNRER